ncbi:DUF4181 domain-containing protein [Priestia abyssalis]|uniref:DUF4181 domain-containing protein n=1 Tax=Priestia abyssalis TaxID=1221450 RepID=UPI00099497EB|nr:DUF4181 domain-containing protein [Priestia abyssalis]
MGFIYILLLFVIYMTTESFLRKKLKTKPQKGFSKVFKGRNKIFVAIEIVLFISFFIIIFSLPSVLPVFGSFVFIFILYVLRGLEEWMFRRHEKEYYHSWLAACFFLLAYIVALITW